SRQHPRGARQESDRSAVAERSRQNPRRPDGSRLLSWTRAGRSRHVTETGWPFRKSDKSRPAGRSREASWFRLDYRLAISGDQSTPFATFLDIKSLAARGRLS